MNQELLKEVAIIRDSCLPWNENLRFGQPIIVTRRSSLRAQLLSPNNASRQVHSRHGAVTHTASTIQRLLIDLCRADGEAPWSPLAPKAATPDLIMSLPPELRNHVYELALVERTFIFAVPRTKTSASRNPRGLLRTSKAIRSETLPIYYGRNGFLPDVEAFDEARFSVIASWLEGVVKVCGRQPFNRLLWCLPQSIPLIFAVGAASISYRLFSLRRLVEVVHTSGIDLVDEIYKNRHGYLPRNRNISKAGRLYVEGVEEVEDIKLWAGQSAAVMQALQLGKRAHDEDWSAARLEKEFNSFARSWLKLG